VADLALHTTTVRVFYRKAIFCLAGWSEREGGVYLFSAFIQRGAWMDDVCVTDGRRGRGGVCGLERVLMFDGLVVEGSEWKILGVV
jgi:hypothetical protein